MFETVFISDIWGGWSISWFFEDHCWVICLHVVAPFYSQWGSCIASPFAKRAPRQFREHHIFLRMKSSNHIERDFLFLNEPFIVRVAWILWSSECYSCWAKDSIYWYINLNFLGKYILIAWQDAKVVLFLSAEVRGKPFKLMLLEFGSYMWSLAP